MNAIPVTAIPALLTALRTIRDERAAHLIAHWGSNGRFDRWQCLVQEAIDAGDHQDAGAATDMVETLRILRREMAQHLVVNTVKEPEAYTRWIALSARALHEAVGDGPAIAASPGLGEVLVRFGGRVQRFGDYRDASNAWCAFRDKSGLGASEMPGVPEIVDAQGRAVGYISYNGRVWPGDPREWKPGVQPLYDNRDVPECGMELPAPGTSP